VLFRTRRRDKCSRLKEGVGVAFEKAVRRKPLARRTRDLCKLNGAREGCRSSRDSSRAVEEELAHLCKDESMAELSLGGDGKEMSGGNGDTLRRSALNRANSWGCGRMISCSRGQERWRTELELCGGESFDDSHRSAALGTAPQRVRGRSGRRFRFVFRWSGVIRFVISHPNPPGRRSNCGLPTPKVSKEFILLRLSQFVLRCWPAGVLAINNAQERYCEDRWHACQRSWIWL
jgi:hypothetical protein